MKKITDISWIIFLLFIQMVFSQDGPVLEIFEPLNSTITSDNSQNIIVYLYDEDGIDSTSFLIIINGVYLDSNSLGITYDDGDSLLIFDPAGAGMTYDEGIILAEVSARDYYGNQSVIAWYFTVDLSPPFVQFIYPDPWDILPNNQQELFIGIYDELSSVDIDSINLSIQNIPFNIESPAICWDGDTLSFNPVFAEPPFYFADGDCVFVTLSGISDNVHYGLPNQAEPITLSYGVDLEGPIADIILPLDSTHTSDQDQEIVIQINSEANVLPLSIQVSLEGITYDYSATCVNFDLFTNMLTFMPEFCGVNFYDGQWITASIDSLDDGYGNHLQNPTQWSFYVDLSPPTLSNLFPTLNDTVIDIQQDISVDITDPSDIDSILFYIEYDSLFLDFDIDDPALSWDGLSLSFTPEFAEPPLVFPNNTLITVSIEACDGVEYGFANCLEFSSWSFIIANGEGPIVTEVFPYHQDISSSQEIKVNFNTPWLNESSIQLAVQDTVYNVFCPCLTFNNNIGILEFNPTAIGSTFENDDIISASIEAAEDLFGNPLQNPQSWSFLMDTNPPEISNIYPEPGSCLSDSLPPITLTLTDLGGNLDAGSIAIEVIINDSLMWTDYEIWGNELIIYPWWYYGISDGSILEIEFSVSDAVDYGPPNIMDTSWSYVFDTTVPEISYYEPMNYSVTSDSLQPIFIELFDVSNILFDSILITVDTSMYYLDDNDFIISDSTFTLEFYPGNVGLLFYNGQAVEVCIEGVSDNCGNNLDAFCWHFDVDLIPPEITSIHPPPYSSISLLDTLIIAVTDEDVDSLSFELTINGYTMDPWDCALDFVWQSDEWIYNCPLGYFNFTDGEWIDIWLSISDSVDYGTPNTAFEEWSYTVNYGGPAAHIVAPHDSSLTSDPFQNIEIFIFDSSGIDTSSILWLIQDSVYTIEDDVLTITGNNESVILNFSSFFPFSDGEQVFTSLLNVEDVYGFPLQDSLSWSFTVDLSGPVAQNPFPAGGLNITDTLVISVEIIDSVGFVDTGSIALIVDSLYYNIDDSVLVWNDPLLIFYPDSSAMFALSYLDSVEVCVMAYDYVDYGTPNSMQSGPFCWSFDILSAYMPKVPEEFSLSPAYPNPFNPITTIGYSVPVISDVNISIYDVNGRKITDLLKNNQLLKPSYHTIEWNADGLPSGLYFIRMTATGFSSTQKVLLLK